MDILPLVSPDGRSTAAVSTFGARVLRWNCRSRERIFVPALLERDERGHQLRDAGWIILRIRILGKQELVVRRIIEHCALRCHRRLSCIL